MAAEGASADHDGTVSHTTSFNVNEEDHDDDDDNNNNLELSMEELSFHRHHHNPPPLPDAAIDIQLHHQQQLLFNYHFIHDQELLSYDPQHPNWDSNVQEMLDIAFNGSGGLHRFISPEETPSPYPPTPDLTNLFNLARSSASSLLPNSSITFDKAAALGFVGDVPVVGKTSSTSSSMHYDPLFNLPPQPPILRDLFQSLPPHAHAYTLPAWTGCSLFGGGGGGGGDDHGLYQDGDGDIRPQQFDNGVLEFAGDVICIPKGRNGKATEQKRSEKINEKYQALRSLVPNPGKNDRASVVADAIEYIKELLRTVNELKILVDKKRCARGRSKRRKNEADDAGDVEGCNLKPLGDPDQSYNLRSSWLQRKSKDTEVEVHIVDDEVTVKLVQGKKINCLLFVSKVLDELQLDLHHVAGGHVGDYYSFLFNTKIYEGSAVYASAIANRVIEVVDGQYASTPATSC